jgi:hypothetical protein
MAYEPNLSKLMALPEKFIFPKIDFGVFSTDERGYSRIGWQSPFFYAKRMLEGL